MKFLRLSAEKRKPVTHDYTIRHWGHDFTFQPGPDNTGKMVGWGYGLAVDDYIIIPNGEASTRYRIQSVRYMSDPSDMWSADVIFDPRPCLPSPKG